MPIRSACLVADAHACGNYKCLHACASAIAAEVPADSRTDSTSVMQATAATLQCAQQLQRHLGSPRLSARGACHAAEALQHLAAAVQPGRKQQRGLAPRFATLAHDACWAVDAMAAAPQQQVWLQSSTQVSMPMSAGHMLHAKGPMRRGRICS